jgi:hypothetical protein
MEARRLVELTGTNRPRACPRTLRGVLCASRPLCGSETASRSCRFPSVSVVIASGERPVTFRTRKLSLSAPMVLQGGPCGRVGHRRTILTDLGPGVLAPGPRPFCWRLTVAPRRAQPRTWDNSSRVLAVNCPSPYGSLPTARYFGPRGPASGDEPVPRSGARPGPESPEPVLRPSALAVQGSARSTRRRRGRM